MIAAPGVYSVTVRDLAIDSNRVAQGCGYRDAVPEIVHGMIADMLAHVAEFHDVTCGYVLLDEQDVFNNRGLLTAAGQRLSIGSIVSNRLRGIRTVAVFVATAGSRYHAWAASHAGGGDVLQAYLADAIGAEIAEAAAELVASGIGSHASALSWNATNRYSPGYCDWPVSDQRGLFALLPPVFCGVTVNASAMMQPPKSVSGIVGIGPKARWAPYDCEACGREHCAHKRD